MTALLGLKLFLVPTLIGGLTLTGRRWGPGVAGWLSAFPVISGPILYFVAIDHGPGFAATATEGTFSALPANIAFGLAYAWVSLRHGWPVSLAAAFVAYCVIAVLVAAASTPLVVSIPIVLFVLIVAPKLYPRVHATPISASKATRPSNADIPLRMLTGAAMVMLVTHFAATLGPRNSGVAAMFPVMGSVLVVFSHRHSGAAFAVRLLKGMLLGFYSFGTFCLALITTLRATSVGMAFVVSLASAAAVLALSRLWLAHGQRDGAAPGR